MWESGRGSTSSGSAAKGASAIAQVRQKRAAGHLFEHHVRAFRVEQLGIGDELGGSLRSLELEQAQRPAVSPQLLDRRNQRACTTERLPDFFRLDTQMFGHQPSPERGN